LAENNINIDMISSSLHCITCLISANSADEAAAALRSEFELE
jgi:aspartokinase